MNTQKTAVEWLLNKVWDLYDENFTVPNRLIEMIEQAKEIEKNQIINTYNKGKNIANCGGYDLTAEQYFEETFKN